MKMKCPFKKKTSYFDRYGTPTDDKEAVEKREEFEDCDEEECMAFLCGTCKLCRNR